VHHHIERRRAGQIQMDGEAVLSPTCAAASQPQPYAFSRPDWSRFAPGCSELPAGSAALRLMPPLTGCTGGMPVPVHDHLSDR
jgi:hypothetical protein